MPVVGEDTMLLVITKQGSPGDDGTRARVVPDDALYAIYTSGSTGNPIGVWGSATGGDVGAWL